MATVASNSFLEDGSSSATSKSTTTTTTKTDQSNALAVDTKKKRNSRVPERFRQDRERALAGRSNRELMRLLIYEEYEAKDTRRLLHTAFDRLELEAQRVAEAEDRVLEIAERFRTINDARVAAQQEAARANEDLRLYKFQYNNAQQEIFRAQGILKTIEGQRDDAEASAVRARDTARRYREKQLVYVAREEGRRLGYEEGIRHAKSGYEGIRAIEYRDAGSDYGDEPTDRFISDEPFNDVESDDGSITPEPLSPGSLDLQGLPSATMTEEAGRHTPQPRIVDVTAPISPNGVALGSSRPVTWHPGNGGAPVIVHNSAPGPHPEPPIPPDNWIPRADENNVIAIPPPHEFDRPPLSPSSEMNGSPWVRVSPSPTRESFVFDQASVQSSVPPPVPSKHTRRPSSPMSSVGSTTYSQFDLTAVGPEMTSSPLVRGRNLSVIQEGSYQEEPTPSGRRSRMETTVTNTPALETDYGYSPMTDLTLTSPQAIEAVEANKPSFASVVDPKSQRFADGLRYSDPDMFDAWRRSAAEQTRSPNGMAPPPGPSRPPGPPRPRNITRPAPLSPDNRPVQLSPHSNVSSGNRHSVSHSQSSRNSKIPIDVQPPSTPEESYDVDHPHTPGLLSPFSLPPVSLQPVPQGTPKIVQPQIQRASSSQYDQYGSDASHSPRPRSPERDPRDRRRSKSTPREPVPRSTTPYAVAPIPEGVNYPTPAPRPRQSQYAPQISSSLSADSNGLSSPRSSVSRVGHDRSLSMHAGATPAHMGRPLSSAAVREVNDLSLRRQPSVASSMSGSSSIRSSSYKAYDPNDYVDPAFLASSDDLLAIPVPAPSSRSSSSRNGKRAAGR